MKGTRGLTTCALVLYVAGAAEQSLTRWTLLGGRFDFLLLALSALCLFTSRRGGMVVGFFDGWLMGALDGANMWQYILSRTVGGFLISWIAGSSIERNYVSALLSGALAVVLCQVVLMFFAPPSSILGFLEDTIRTAVYNGVLATLCYAGLNRIFGPRS